VVSGQPIPPETEVPLAWREEVGEPEPLTMSDGVDAAYVAFERGFAPESALDQAILATRRAVFPELGLDPGL
jgi:acetoin utilization protein AcuC